MKFHLILYKIWVLSQTLNRISISGSHHESIIYETLVQKRVY